MELVEFRPLGPDFSYLVNFSASSDVVAHQAADLFQRNITQLSSDP
jgi:hypothetical protein